MPTSNKPVVSVVMPAYNAQRFISQSIEGVISQNFEHWELLISEDCSSDNTLEIIQGFAQRDSRIKVLRSHTNLGVTEARNRSIKAASGKYIAFCDSDDTWDPEKLETQISFMEQHPEYALSYHNYRVIDSNNKVIRHRVSPVEITYNDLLKCCRIGCLSVMINVEITGKLLMPSMNKREDWAYWLLILRKYKSAFGINKEMASYRVGYTSLSSNKLGLIKHQYAVFRNSENFGALRSFWMTFRFVLIHIVRKLKREI